MPGYALMLAKKLRRCTILSTTHNVYSYCLWPYLTGDSSQVFASHCVQTLIVCYRSVSGVRQSSCLVFNLSVQVPPLVASSLDSRERDSTSKRSKNSRPIGPPAHTRRTFVKTSNILSTICKPTTSKPVRSIPCHSFQNFYRYPCLQIRSGATA